MSEHTPVPWEVAEYDADQVEVCGPRETHVAFCNNSARGRVDARLIADAPCLLAALRRLANAAERFAADQSEATDTRCGLVQPVTVAECEELNAALAEAWPLVDRFRPPTNYDDD